MAYLIPLNILIPVGLTVIILIIIVWILFSKNKKLYKDISSKKEKFSRYESQMQILEKTENPQKKDFIRLNKVARAFFKEYLNLDYSLTYLELEKDFKKQNKTNYSKFCKLMSDANYQEQNLSPAQIKQLIDSFSKILEEYK